MFTLAGAAARRSLFLARNSNLLSTSGSRLLLAHTTPFSSKANDSTDKFERVNFLKELGRRAVQPLSEQYDEMILSNGSMEFRLNADGARVYDAIDKTRSRAVVSLYEEMPEQGLKPASRTLSDTIIPALVCLRLNKAAVSICDKLSAEGLKPSTEAGWSWVDAYCLLQRTSDANDVLSNTAEDTELNLMRYLLQYLKFFDTRDFDAMRNLFEARNSLYKHNAQQSITDHKFITEWRNDTVKANDPQLSTCLIAFLDHMLAGNAHAAVEVLRTNRKKHKSTAASANNENVQHTETVDTI
eukprot:11459-Heterococcus_DN1.PRE.2